MAEGNGTDGGLARFGETAIAFDELIVQVGRAIARAQQEMDLSQVEFQRRVARALQEGRMRRLEVPAPHAYTLPETSLSLKIGLSMSYSEGGGAPSLSAVPLNATTTNEGDINVEASTEVNLRFVSVPPSKEPSGPAPSALTPVQAQQLALADPRVSTALAALDEVATPWLDYAEEARLWTLAWLVAREPALVVLVDDRNKAVLGVVAQDAPPPGSALALVGAPIFHRVEPAAARQGEVLTLHGDDFLTLAGQTVLEVDGRPVPPLRLSMRTLAFKLPAWVTRGDVKVTTPLGSTGEAGRAAFAPLPRFEGFEPRRGTYDMTRQRGSALSVQGSNLRPGCRLRFATGVLSAEVELLSPTQAQVEVPSGAGSGPLTLVFGAHEQTLPEPTFVMLPRIERVSPRQARVGDEVTVSGSSLEHVEELVLGEALVPRQAFVLHTPEQLRLRVPPSASDGPVRLRQRPGGTEAPIEVLSRDLFYVVPRITGFVTRVVTPGQLLTLRGEGLDPSPDMMVLLFEGRTGMSEAPVLAVSADRRSLTTRVPVDAVTGFVLLLRKRVYSDTSPADTSNTSENKLTVLTLQGDPSDLLLEERFEGDLSRWGQEAGTWRLEQGLLASTGTSRLGLALPAPRQTLAVYADVLRAQRFGFSLVPAGGGPSLQVWMDLASASPALTWSTVDSRGRQVLLGGLPLALLAGDNHLAQLTVERQQLPDRSVLALTFSLNQEPVHTQVWEVTGVERLALLADAADQRWDNVVVLAGPFLSLPEPELYRFGTIPTPPVPPALHVEGFTPLRGPPGTQVSLTGTGLDAAARFFFGGVEAAVLQAEGARAVVEVPAGARTGPIEIRGRGGAVVTTGEQLFTLPPRIVGMIPNPVLAGAQLHLTGTNLPAALERLQVAVLGTTARVVAAAPSLVTVLVPDVSGTGPVEVRTEGFTAQAPQPLVVRREEVLQDLLQAAAQAQWSTSAGEVTFGRLGEATEPSVLLREKERLEDDREHGPVLCIHPPAPALRALRGVYPAIDLPATGGLELRLAFGMLWGAAPRLDDPADVDGVLFEVGFRVSGSGEEVPLLPRSACVHDSSLERYVVDARSLAGRRGQLVLSIFPGRGGLRDDAALTSAQVVRMS
jgi:hypothetical protein